ncbi:hypothetical protein HD554DRAFT_2085760 [Boletus coccyginus]|nr:hypothetical protein HD554DRAFT_2085760 [Boletus coccyginus]
MAKGKNLNPADAHRKAQRKKELKKNKAERAKTRDFALVKKDTRGRLLHSLSVRLLIMSQIWRMKSKSLKRAPNYPTSDKSRLTNLKNELSKIMQKKDEYVKEHPEQRKLVYRTRKQETGESQKAAPPVEQKRNLFNKHGLPRHPERSIYYDSVMNPYGIPPPGMPYIERPLTTDEEHSGEDIGDLEEDIVMPEGPPPSAGLKDSDSGSDDDIPMPEGPPPGDIPVHLGALPPPPPPGFFPRRIQSTTTIQDHLSSITHQTYQVHRTNQLPPGHPSLPQKPPAGTSGTIPASGVYTGAIISAEPELRDLKKEATAFVPASLKRKKASGLPSSSRINAAPSVNAGLEATSLQTRPDLVGVLKSQLGTVSDKALKAPVVKKRDDYQNFVDEISDLLGPPGSS